MRFSHPKLGRFVYKHKGNGIIVDNFLKPMRRVASSLGKTVVKPFAKKALQSCISHAGDKLGKKAAEKSSDLIMKKLADKFKKPSTPSIPSTPTSVRPQEESTDMILNRLISGSGIKRRRKRSSEYLQRNELVRYWMMLLAHQETTNIK